MIMANDGEYNSISDTDFLTDNDEIGPNIISSGYYDMDEFNDLCKQYDHKNDISVLSINARSLIKNFHEFNVILENLNISFDYITVCETWLDKNLESLVQLEGYSFVTRHKSKRKEGGGIGIYIKNGINYIERNDLDCLEGYDEF